MVKLEQRADGYYVLEAIIGCTKVEKVFMDADKPLEDVSTEHKADGFFLNIPDKE